MLTIDKHLIPFTGADRYNDNFVISDRPKGGTSRFETYATMQAASEERLPTVTVVHLTDDTTKVKFVRKLFSESKKIMLKKVNNSHGSRTWQCGGNAFSGRAWREIPDGGILPSAGQDPDNFTQSFANTSFQPSHRFHFSQITASNDCSYKSTASREVSGRSAAPP